MANVISIRNILCGYLLLLSAITMAETTEKLASSSSNNLPTLSGIAEEDSTEADNKGFHPTVVSSLRDSKFYKAVVKRFKNEKSADENPGALLPHRPNYFMPVTYQTKVNNEPYDEIELDIPGEFQHYEFVTQLSIKYILADNIAGPRSKLAVGYTNKSFWQAYNRKMSAPFRETNHEPEIMLSWGGVNNPLFDYFAIGFNHQSNGQTASLSRSWNRVITTFAKLWPSSAIMISPWWRIPETNKADPDDPSDNDNPDIHEYLGYGDFLYIRLMDQHSFSMHLRNNLDRVNNKGSVALEWSFPLTKKSKAFLHYFNGYGESLIDYNVYQERFGIGIKISDWI